MKVGMTLPLMEPGIDGEMLERWARAVDQGPFASLCFGERVAFGNPELIALLGACAAWTRRVRLKTTVVVAPLHDPVWLAKALATGDLISGGRLTVGLGIGGREEDYTVMGADPGERSQASLARRVAAMRRVWAGEESGSAGAPVGPLPVQAGGPELLAGAQGPRAIRAAAQWADGLAGFSFNLNLDEVAAGFELARQAWREAQRPAPRLTTAFWFALDDADRSQLQRHLRHYFNWIDPATLETMLPTTGFAGSAEELQQLLHRLEELGTDEVHLIPTSTDLGQLDRIAELVAGRWSLE